AEPLRVLQMNLCDSGIAGCYTGRSVAEAAGVIRADEPGVVTLNEVCQEDVDALDRAMTIADGGGVVVSAFKSAGDRLTAGPYRCRNGQPYGIGLVVHIVRYRGYTTSSALYPTQDLNDPEERAWVCLYAIGAFYACTTHLADTSRVIALAQCRYLLNTIVPAVRDRNGGLAPTVIGGDLNLGIAGPQNVEACVPSGYMRRGDGGVQYVIATADLSPASERAIAMHGTTDHPGLLVSFKTSGVPADAARSHRP
ncbi:MAG TPA: endonuclease/exonuclease/phosphatase family protein, partial [Micromonosporaceae bacterium]